MLEKIMRLSKWVNFLQEELQRNDKQEKQPGNSEEKPIGYDTKKNRNSFFAAKPTWQILKTKATLEQHQRVDGAGWEWAGASFPPPQNQQERLKMLKYVES